VRERAEKLLKTMLGADTTFRDGQWEAIKTVAVKKNRALIVQRTGWGKSIVYFIATKLLREEELNGIHNDIVSLEKQITGLLDGAEYEELAAQLSSYGDLGHVRDLATIESAMKELNDKKVGLLVKRESLETNIAKWQSEYGDVNGLLEQIIEVKILFSAVPEPNS
jgi:hypothetical protein